MVPPQEIVGYLRAQPFRPFQIRMASGQTFDIRHPEMVRVGRNSLVVFTYVDDNLDIHDRWDTVPLMLVESAAHSGPSAA